ncbi:hypothetical protein, partial [Flavobacterium sp.]|uniref:hypothetical protein n=1 Tax=Flavobacterium sp. TaxID=239 RepID=UPI0025C26E16
MEYEKIYNEAYLVAHIETEKYIKDFLITKENSINYFTENYRNIEEKYRDEYNKDKFNQVDLFTDLYVEFVRGRKKIK